jgi:hypothetical protein
LRPFLCRRDCESVAANGVARQPPAFRGVTICRFVNDFLDGYEPRGLFLLFGARADHSAVDVRINACLQSDANVGTVYPRFASAPDKSSIKFNSTLRQLEHDPEKACPGLDPGWIPVSEKHALGLDPRDNAPTIK